MLLSHNLFSHYIQHYFIKSTNCTYLLLILIKLHSQYTKPHLSIIINELFFIVLLKYTSSLIYC